MSKPQRPARHSAHSTHLDRLDTTDEEEQSARTAAFLNSMPLIVDNWHHVRDAQMRVLWMDYGPALSALAASEGLGAPPEIDDSQTLGSQFDYLADIESALLDPNR